jgi:hypothetical protein
MTMPTATADVKIATPARYMTRLAKHFEHRIQVQRDDATAKFTFTDGRCDATAGESTLKLSIQATSEEALRRYQEVVTRHLKQVAAQETFEVEWIAGP